MNDEHEQDYKDAAGAATGADRMAAGLPCIPDPIRGDLDELRRARERVRLLEGAAKALCRQMDIVHNHDLYKGVWALAHSHGLDYKDGPTYEHELKALHAALTATDDR